MKYITRVSMKNRVKSSIKNSLAILVLSSFQTLSAEEGVAKEIMTEEIIISTVCNESKCAIAPEPGAMSNDANIQSQSFSVPPNSEMLLPGETLTFWGLDEVVNATGSKGKTVTIEKEISETTSVASNEQIDDIRFVSGKHYISDKFVEQMRDVLARLSHVNNLRVHFIGHTDSQRLGAKTRAIYGDNYGLGKSRAKRTADFFQKKLNLSTKSISYEGKGSDEPIASNDTSEGMALNRRVEIQIWHDAVVKRKVAQEKFISATSGINRTQVCRQQNLCRRVEQSGRIKRIVLENAIAPIRYKSGRSIITDEYTKRLQGVVDSLKGKQSLQLMFVGHTDNQPLSANTQKTFIDNQGLSMARAKRAAEHFSGKLGLDESAIIYDGRGYSEPVASNDTPQGMSLNRRVEVEISYLAPDETQFGFYGDEIIQCPTGNLPANVIRIGGNGFDGDKHSQENLYTDTPYSMTPWRVSVDGDAIVNGQPRHGADVQRCVDVALEKAELQLQYDRLKAEPMLNLATWPNVVADGQMVYFRGWSNYPHWIKRAEVIIYTLGVENQKQIIKRIELNKVLENSWQVADVSADKLWYNLRVYDDAGRYDETLGKSLFVEDEYIDDDDTPDESLREEALRAGYGKNNLIRQNIPVVGGTITANGIHVPQDKNVWIMGQAVPLDKKGSFVAQQIVPVDLHTAEVAVLDGNGNGELLWRDLEFKMHDWFYVGLADITFSLNETSGATDLLTEDDLDDNSADGRIAFYVKGKFKNKYTLTSSLDSREEPLDELFSNFHKKDPSSLLRRLDSEDHYPTFGDDSTLYEDAPTQGKFYAKIEDGKSHALWGNFKVNIAENELAVINRGLYGGHVGFQSEAFTKSGNRRTRLDLFAAEPGTVPAFEEFRGTGGSLYYLRHGDITNGSEQLRIEVRDKDSGFVLSSTVMLAGQDYELDALQGIVLLTKPLNSTASGHDLVRSSSLSGHPISLVVNYEYVSGFNDTDALAVGGRVEHWLSDGIQLGVTGSNQDQTGGEQKLGSVDLTLKKTEGTWIKVIGAKSRGPGVVEQKSIDGGFGFDGSVSGIVDDEAEAKRVEAAFKLSDVGIDSPVKGTVYWQDREAGFSSSGQQTSVDVTETGVKLNAELNDSTELELRYNERDETNGRDKKAAEVDLKKQLGENWSVSIGARGEERNDETLAPGSVNQGKRTDAVLRADYDSHKNWDVYAFVQGTVDHDDTRETNDRAGVGAGWKAGDNVRLFGEVSDGDLGAGALAGADYQMSEQTSLYLNYALDSDNPNGGIGDNKSTVIVGGRSRFSDYASVYAEEKYTSGNQPRGLTQAYGIDLSPDENWTYGLNLEIGKLESETSGEIDRKAIGFRLGYVSDKSKYGGAIEFRNDESDSEERDSWLVRNTYQYQTSDDWRLVTRLDLAFSESSLSDSSVGDSFNGDFVEGVLGYAWRPAHNDRWNGLFKYTYFYDLTSPQQLTPAEVSIDFQQRSHVLSFDINYDISKRWTFGSKYAFRRSELRDRLETTDWFRSDAHLGVLRADWHVIKKWDLLLEARVLDLPDANDTRSGALVGVYRHVGQHFKFGLGYNFTEFSDDLTDLDFDAEGVFINLVGKI